MKLHRISAGVVLCLLLTATASADYLKVSRNANVRAEPSTSSNVLYKAKAGTDLLLLDGTQTNGYYHVQLPAGESSQSGWIYRTLVRRYKGSPPDGGQDTSTSGSGLAQDLLNCALPFESIKEDHPIDQSCGPKGKTDSASSRLQNAAKNNFCAKGAPILLTFDTFLKLQKAAEDNNVHFGSGRSLPPDRSVLKNILPLSPGVILGEDAVVRLVAFVVDAHYSNVYSGETVNCGLKGKENNDIHIMLGPKSDTAACETVTAEMSPHFRPAAWDQLAGHNLRYPVRITGQLFFDASHSPCKNGKGPNPKRESIWEIHPVYAIEVCSNTTLAGCRDDDESVWSPLNEFLSSEE